jgi:hypothetical protein
MPGNDAFRNTFEIGSGLCDRICVLGVVLCLKEVQSAKAILSQPVNLQEAELVELITANLHA